MSVSFAYANWSAQYPEFSTTTSGQAQGYFNLATLYLDNTGAGLVADDSVGGILETILYLLTAHVATIMNGNAVSGPASPLVGRIDNATQGSVSVHTALEVPMSAQWFAQTKYGLMAWQALAPYRMAVYFEPCPNDPPGPGSLLYPGFNPTW